MTCDAVMQLHSLTVSDVSDREAEPRPSQSVSRVCDMGHSLTDSVQNIHPL